MFNVNVLSDPHPLSQSPVNNGLIPEAPQCAVAPTESTSIKSESMNHPSPPPSGRSWFGSFTRSRENDAVPKSQSLASSRIEVSQPSPQSAESTHIQPTSLATEDSASHLNDVSRIHVVPPSPRQKAVIDEQSSSLSAGAHSPSQPIPILHEPTATRSWFSLSASSTPQEGTTPNDSRPRSSLSTNSPISVDDEVPKTQSTRTEIYGSNTSVSPASQFQKEGMPVSSLTQSTSRFALRIPLLGRPKVPLDQVVAIAQAEDIGKLSGDRDESYNQNAQIPPTAGAVIVSHVQLLLI
jgi:hypothetical protein